MTERRKKLIYTLALLGGRQIHRAGGYYLYSQMLMWVSAVLCFGLLTGFEAMIRYRFPSNIWLAISICAPIGVFFIFFFDRLFSERLLRAVRLTKKQIRMGHICGALLPIFAFLFLYLMTKWRDLVT